MSLSLSAPCLSLSLSAPRVSLSLYLPPQAKGGMAAPSGSEESEPAEFFRRTDETSGKSPADSREHEVTVTTTGSASSQHLIQ